MAEDKTEAPTPKRLKDAQKEGQFPRTQDASTWASIAAGFALLPLSARLTEQQFRELFARLPQVANDPSPAVALQAFAELPKAIAYGAGPMCAAAAFAALAATAMQGVHPSSKALMPKFSRMNPGPGLKRMFGPKGAWEGVKAVLKVSVLGAVVYVVGRGLLPQFGGGGTLPLATTVARTEAGLRQMVWAGVLAGVAIAGADYAYQRRTTMKQLKMSMDEIKKEHKQSEGDPQVKAQIRAKQMAMSRNRMLSAVPKADVVMVNPTHLAVALKYQPGAGAPRVVAKGAGGTALKIRELAKENQVPVIEDKPLARVLYRVCELNEEIPAELYTAVAQILAFVMAAGRPSKRDGARRTPQAATIPDLPTRTELRNRRAKEIRASRSAPAGPRR